MTPEFRFANASDAPAVTSFVTQETHLHAGPRTDLATISAQLANSNWRIILYEDDCRLIGCAAMERVGAAGRISMFAVRPGLEAQNLGNAVLAEAEKTLVALWGCSSATLTVINLQSALIAFYQRRGYALTDEQAPFPFDEAQGVQRRDYHVVVMRKSLSPA